MARRREPEMFTLAMLEEWMEEEGARVVRYDVKTARIAWLEPFSTREAAAVLPKDMALACEVRDLQGLKVDAVGEEACLQQLLVVIVCPGSRQVPADFPLPCLVVETELSKDLLVAKLQARACEIDAWDRKLSEITMSRGTFQDLIDASESMLGNYITMTDASFRLMAYTRHLEVEDFWINELTRNGFHSKESIERFRKMKAVARWSKQRRTRYSGEDHFTKYPIINHVYHLNGRFFSNMVMSCNNVPYSRGLFDRFEILVGHVEAHIANQHAARKRRPVAHEAFLRALVLGERTSEEYREAQMAQLKLSADDSFTVYAAALGPGTEETLSYLAGELNMLFPGWYYVQDGGLLYAVLKLSAHNRVAELAYAEELLSEMAVNHDAFIGRSTVVDGARNLHFGAQQARAALAVARSHGGGIEHFEDVLYLHLMTSSRFDRAFFSYCLESSFLGAMLRVRSSVEIDDAHVLRCYLEHERRIEQTAQALGLHRNTVAQRIAHIRRTYNVDFETHVQRQNAFALFSIADMLEK